MERGEVWWPKSPLGFSFKDCKLACLVCLYVCVSVYVLLGLVCLHLLLQVKIFPSSSSCPGFPRSLWTLIVPEIPWQDRHGPALPGGDLCIECLLYVRAFHTWLPLLFTTTPWNSYCNSILQMRNSEKVSSLSPAIQPGSQWQSRDLSVWLQSKPRFWVRPCLILKIK